MPIELNTKTPNTQTAETMFNKFTEVANDNTKAKDIQSKALEVLAGTNVKVTRSDDTSAGGIGEKKTFGATNIPVLDNPDDVKAKEADLAKLIAYLQLDNQDRQTEMAKDRIDMQKAGLDTEQKDRMKQIDESIKKMEKAERAAKLSRIFGWIGAILAVAAAAVLTVVTGGLAAGFAIAGAALGWPTICRRSTAGTRTRPCWPLRSSSTSRSWFCSWDAA